MTSEELLSLFKYFHGESEEDCPFEHGSKEGMWWFGERMIYDQTINFPDFFSNFKEQLATAIKDGQCSGRLIDESLSLDQRTIIFYLDLWHGKWFPYDDWGVIDTY